MINLPLETMSSKSIIDLIHVLCQLKWVLKFQPQLKFRALYRIFQLAFLLNQA